MQINKSSINPVFKFQDHSINIFGSDDNMMFFGGQVAKALGYSNTRDAISTNVWNENKMTIKEYIDNKGCSSGRPPLNLQPHTILINEFGLYQLILSSKLERAKEFQKWVMSVVLPTIRKTGTYNQPQLTHNQFVILNEADLQMKIVQYLRTFYPDVLFNATLGENQSTPQKRIDSYFMGYSKGMVDLIIYENSKHFNGLCIEMKSPSGKSVLSEHQKSIILKLEERGFKCVVSDNYDNIIIEINDYLKNIRHKCYYCKNRYSSLDKLSTHLRVIHKK